MTALVVHLVTVDKITRSVQFFKVFVSLGHQVSRERVKDQQKLNGVWMLCTVTLSLRTQQ